jgi:hypothetical protein
VRIPLLWVEFSARSTSRRRRWRAGGRAGGRAVVGPRIGRAVAGHRHHRGDDPLVARAPAQVAGQRDADLVLGHRAPLPFTQQRVGGDQEARGAEATLQRVMLGERALQRAELAVGGGQPLDGGDRSPVGLHGEHQTGPDRLAVERDRTRSAHAVLAADVGAGEPGVMADEVREQRARLDQAVDGGPVEADGDPHARAPSTARLTVTRVLHRPLA